MAYIDLVRSHVERCLQESFDLCRVEADPEGDYPFRDDTAAYFVRVLDGDPVLVNVISWLVRDIPKSAKLLAELNDINSRLMCGRVYYANRAVCLEESLLAASVDAYSLGGVCQAIGRLAAEFGPMLAAVFGGKTWFPAEDSESVEP